MQRDRADERRVTLQKSILAIPLRAVFSDATPVALSYVPLAILYGALAQAAGLTLIQTVAMSLLVYSGAAQLLTVQMLAAGASHVGILIAGTVLTVRHILMGASIGLYTRALSPLTKAILSPLMTDESFALAWKRYRMESDAHGYFFGANLYLYVTWSIASMTGHALGETAPALSTVGLDLIFPLLFLAVLISIISTRTEAIAAGVGLAFAFLTRAYIPAEWSIPLTGLVAAAAGVALDRRSGMDDEDGAAAKLNPS